MSLKARFTEMFDRLTCATALSLGDEWSRMRRDFDFELDVLEKRLQALEEVRPTIVAKGKR